MSWHVSTFSETIRNSKLFKGFTEVTKEGKTTYIYGYESLIFEVCNLSVRLKGSLHEYYNDGNNSNDFTRCHVIDVLNDLWYKFRINPHTTLLNTLEIGVNLNYSPKKFISAIIDYKGKSTFSKKDMLLSECKLERYRMKAYDKVSGLRIEVHFRKMIDVKKRGVRTLADLTTPENFEVLGKMFLEYFDNYLIFDNTLCLDNLKPRDRELLTKGRENHYWDELRKVSPENYKKKRLRFKELIRNYQQDTIQNEVRCLIVEKLSLLCEPEKTFPKLTDCRKQQFIKTLPELTKSSIPQQSEFDSSINTDFPQSNHLDKELKKVQFLSEIRHKKKNIRFSKGPVKITRRKFEPERVTGCQKCSLNKMCLIFEKLIPNHFPNYQGRICLITKLPIFMQSENSIFLTPIGVEYYHDHYIEIYKELEKLLTRSKYKNSPIEGKKGKYYAIAHAIRYRDHNERRNPVNSTKNRIRKINSYPVLFNTEELMTPEKRMMAEFGVVWSK